MPYLGPSASRFGHMVCLQSGEILRARPHGAGGAF